MSEYVGNRTVLHKTRLIIPAGEEAQTSFAIGEWEVNVRIIFEETENPNNSGEIRVEAEDNNAAMRFINWRNSLGTATKKPANFATHSDGRRVTFLAAHWAIGDVNVLELLFFIEGRA